MMFNSAKNGALASTAREKDWISEWSTENSKIKISKSNASLKIVGTAVNGANDDKVDEILLLDKDLKGQASVLRHQSGAKCKMDLALFNNALVISQAEECGGLGASFTGAYYRKVK